MDGETIRLIIVACGSIVAGLAGALIAGAFNSENTHATIRAAREAAAAQWERDQDLEHSRWLRDRKVEVYGEFLDKVRELDISMAAIAEGREQDLVRVAAISRTLSSGHFRLYASDKVTEPADQVLYALSRTVEALKTEMDGQGDGQFEAESKRLIEAINELQRAVRADLVES